MKKTLSIIMAVLMVLCIAPLTVSADSEIQNFGIKNLPIPIDSMTASEASLSAVTLDGTGVSIDSAKWEKQISSQSYSDLGTSGRLDYQINGVAKYRANFEIKSTATYVFAADILDKINVESDWFIIDKNNSSLSDDRKVLHLFSELINPYPCVNSGDASGILNPVAGAPAKYILSSVLVSSEKFSFNKDLSSVKNVTDDLVMGPNDTFVSGKDYCYIIRFDAEDDYRFLPKYMLLNSGTKKFTLNSSGSEVDYDSIFTTVSADGKYIYVKTKDFNCTATSENISNVILNGFVAPKADSEVRSTYNNMSTSSNAPYKLNDGDVSWYEGATLLGETDTFKAGTEYECRIKISHVTASYKLTASTQVTLNGETERVKNESVAPDGTDDIVYSFKFTTQNRLSFVLNDGTLVKLNTMTSDYIDLEDSDTKYPPLPTAYREGYRFGGWYYTGDTHKSSQGKDNSINCHYELNAMWYEGEDYIPENINVDGYKFPKPGRIARESIATPDRPDYIKDLSVMCPKGLLEIVEAYWLCIETGKTMDVREAFETGNTYQLVIKCKYGNGLLIDGKTNATTSKGEIESVIYSYESVYNSDVGIDIECSTALITFKPYKIKNTYEVTFDAPGATNLPSPNPMQYDMDKNGTFVDTVPVKEGLEFKGWSLIGPDAYDQELYEAGKYFISFDEDVTLYAVFVSPEVCTLTLDTDGGVWPFSNTLTCRKGQSVTLFEEKPKKEGCTFITWTDSDGNGYDPLTSITLNENITLKAKWETDHIHEFATEFRSDASGHWHECSCGAKTAVEAHKYDAGTITKPATATEKGEKVYTCKTCGYKNILDIPAGGTDVELDPLDGITLKKGTDATVDYRTKVMVTFKSSSTLPEGYFIAVYEGNETTPVATSRNADDKSTVTVNAGELKETTAYTAKIIKASDSSVAAGKDVKVTVTVKAGFFKKIIAFFKGLFNRLPEKFIEP